MKNIKHKTEVLWAHIGLAALSLAAILTVVKLDHVRPKVAESLTTYSAHHGIRDNAEYAQTHGADKQKKHVRKDKDKIRHWSRSYGVHVYSHPVAGPA